MWVIRATTCIHPRPLVEGIVQLPTGWEISHSPTRCVSIRLWGEKVRTKSTQSDVVLTDIAAIVTVWFVTITGTMFACLCVDIRVDMRIRRQGHVYDRW
jgi:hypothetical protein